ncbi:MAG TPA: extracellular solute-binding protein [Azospirillaceae bacterium]|nr:extracellular solute-binding protein [Azospirillaceae bacterium]
MILRRNLLRLAAATPLLPLLPADAAGAGEEASWRHGIAMHGEPALPPGFDRLPYTDPASVRGGAMRQSVTGSWDSLNPFSIRGRAPLYMVAYLYPSLLVRSYDEPFTLYAYLAEAVRCPPGRGWVEFALRPEARWHDGRPVTAADVLFSFETLRSQGRPAYRGNYAKVAAAEAVGERTVRFAFRPGPDGSPDREMPLIMGLMPLLARHWWEGRDLARPFLDEAPLGAGPYRIGAAEPGRHVVYERVEGWWGAELPVNRGLYNFDRIRLDWYRDETVALEAFKAGQVDVRREPDPALWARGYDGPAARDGRMVREEIPHRRVEWTRGFMLNTRRAPLGDPRVREALGLAFDFEWMNRSLFFGAYARTESHYPNSALAAGEGPPSAAELALLEPFRASLDPRVFGPAWRAPRTPGDGPPGQRPHLRRAMELLRAAAFRVEGGRQVGPDGRPLSLEVLLAEPKEERVALEWARSLDRIGVALRLRVVDSAQFQKRVDGFDFDVALHRWVNSLSPGNEQALYYGSAAADQPGSRNYPGIREPAVDALIAAMLRAETREGLVAAARALDRVLTWGHYAVLLWHQPDDRLAYWPPLRRPAATPLYGVTLEAWWAGRKHA